MVSVATPYGTIETEVLEVVPETPTIKTFKLRPRDPIAFAPGQFIDVQIPGVGEAPFTPSSLYTDTETLAVSIMRVGRVTEIIHQLTPGDVIGVRGPLGTGYPLDYFAGKEILVVGGGCGFAPLRSLMYALFEESDRFKKLLFRGGCRNVREMLYFNEIQEWGQRPDLDLVLTVDEGSPEWNGSVGVVTTILDDLNMDCRAGIAVVCGPPVMMKFATRKVLELGFAESNIFLSMEKNMSCGLGKCGHCRLGTYYCCKDGPVFSYDRIKGFPEIWE